MTEKKTRDKHTYESTLQINQVLKCNLSRLALPPSRILLCVLTGYLFLVLFASLCQVIMGDFNDANIIVDPTERRVAGVIDFGDAVRIFLTLHF